MACFAVAATVMVEKTLGYDSILWVSWSMVHGWFMVVVFVGISTISTTHFLAWDG
jgi:hypothetical protein